MTLDEVIGWHHQLNGHECEEALVVGNGQGSLVCCSLWGRTESDTTEATWQQQLRSHICHVVANFSFLKLFFNTITILMKILLKCMIFLLSS